MRLSILLLASLTLAATTSQLALAQGRTIGVTADRPLPGERSFADRVARSQTVLRVRILGEPRGVVLDVAEQIRNGLPGFGDAPALLVATIYTAQVVEVLKEDADGEVTAGTLRLGIAGGAGTWKGTTVRDLHATPPLVHGDEYVVLANYDAAWRAWMITEFDLLHVVDGRVRLLGSGRQAPYLAAIDGASVTAVAAAVRDAVPARQTSQR